MPRQSDMPSAARPLPRCPPCQFQFPTPAPARTQGACFLARERNCHVQDRNPVTAQRGGWCSFISTLHACLHNVVSSNAPSPSPSPYPMISLLNLHLFILHPELAIPVVFLMPISPRFLPQAALREWDNPWQELGVPADSDEGTIKKAYRKLVLQCELPARRLSP